MEKIFSAEGRIRRSTFVLRSIALVLIYLLFWVIAPGSEEPGAIMFYVIVIFGVIVLQILQTIKRLHDLNHTGWLSVLFFIALANLILTIYLIVADGTIGDNKYGPDPKGRTQPV